MKRHWMLACLATLLIAASLHAATIHVAAAISLKDALTDAAPAFKTATGDDVEFSFGASGALLAQIKSGADIDIFISAAAKQMDDAAAAKLIDTDSRRDIAKNTLVLIVPADSKLDLAAFPDLAKPDVKKIAAGEPKTVPAGDYAMQVFKKLNLTETLTAKLVFGANVRQVLSYVERGEVDAGIVYATDAKQSAGKVKVAATADDSDHAPIVYPAAILTASTHKDDAKKFLDFLSSDQGSKFLTTHGFTLPTPATTQK